MANLKLILGIALVLCHQMTEAKKMLKIQERLQSEKPELEVELLIVCDKDFSDRFDQDHQKIIDYWTVYMKDVNMRYQTLTSVDISFRVTSLITINETNDQPFIEEAKQINRGLTLTDVYDRFGKWVYANKQKFPGFDVALLMTSAKMAETEEDSIGKAEYETVCLEDHTLKIYQSVVVLHGSSAWGKDCAALEASFASLFGSFGDGCELNKDCGTDLYLMSTGQCDKMQYFFSKCSNNAIAKFLATSQADCLRKSDAPEVNVLKPSKVTHPPSLTDQCKMITGNNDAFAFKENSQCVRARCKLMHDGKWALMWLNPLDNSPCDEGKVCLRGRCLTQGHLLQNVGSGKCIYSSDKFSQDDRPIMDHCLESPTPLDQIMILDHGPDGKYLATPFNSTEKCLEVVDSTKNDYFLKFTKCHQPGNFLDTDFEEETTFAWDLVQIGKSEEFLLHNRNSMTCVRVQDDGSLKLNEDCDRDDKMMRWTFIKTPIVSLGRFNNKYYSSKCPAF